MSNVVANMVVSFGDVSIEAEIAEIELDNIANDDKTSFSPGDVINFLIHFDQSKLNLIWVRPTSGSVVIGGSKSAERESTGLLWIDPTTSHSLSYIPSGTPVPTWYGNICNGLRMTSKTELKVSGGVFPAVCNLKFQVPFISGKLFTPDVDLQTDESYPIIVVAHFEGK